MKRFLTTMLAAILVIACLATAVFAAGSAIVSGSKAHTTVGGSATVTFSISKATFANYKFKVHYDENYLELKSLDKVGGEGSFASYVDTALVSYAHSANETIEGGLFSATFSTTDKATCGSSYPVSVTVYYVSDTKLDEVQITTKDYEGAVVIDHVYESSVTTPATCGTDGVMTYTCKNCSSSYTEVIPATGEHTGFKWNYDENSHWQECANCDYKTTAEDHKLAWKSDENGHWQECSCGYKTTAADHNYQWKHDEDDHWKECSVCGHGIPRAQHKFTMTSTDGADCQTKGTVVYTCECGYSYTEYNAVGPHDFSKLIETVEPTCGEDGYKLYKCAHCDETHKEVLPATGDHKYEWKYDANKHWKECSVCGHKLDAADHTFQWVIDKKPTTTEYGEKHEECECGCTRNHGTIIDKLKDELDDVPDTGDITPHIVLGIAALIAMLAAVAFTFKRKAVK